MAFEPPVAGGELDEPFVWRGLRRNQRHRSLRELDEASTIGTGDHQKVAANFRVPAPRPPERLALLHLPARA